MKKLCVFLVSVVFVGINLLQAQTVQITGTVTSAEDGMPIPGASVLVKGTSIGVATDLDGKYAITAPTSATTLVYSFVGMMTQEVVIAGRTVINVVLVSDAKELEEVVVIGYGITKKETFTGSASTVQSDKIASMPITSVEKALQGAAPGVMSKTNSGQPGSAADVVVRGIGSINAGTAPLYILDGIPILTGNFSQQSSFDGQNSSVFNALANINPNDIESITILKDAAATSIYGSRASNGVVLITTKSGKTGKTVFDFSFQNGFSNRANSHFQVLNTEQYLELQIEAYKNQGRTDAQIDALLATWPAKDDTKAYTDPSRYYSTNWMDYAYRDNAPTRRYDLSANGGNDQTKFFISAGYFDQDGIVIGSYMERLSFRTNITQKVSDKVSVGANTQFSLTRQGTPLTLSAYYSSPVAGSVFTPPFNPAEVDGQWFDAIIGNNGVNFAAVYDYNDVNSKTYRGLGNVFAEYRPIEGLTLRTNWGADYISVVENSYDDPRSRGNTAFGVGRATASSNDAVSWTNTNTINYRTSFADSHNLDLLVGHEMQGYDYNDLYASSEGFASPLLRQVSSGASPVYTYGGYTGYKLLSFFGRANYDYNGKYYLSLSIRRDGSSRFGADNRFANFYSIGTSWRISEEDFLKDVEFVNNLQLRASFGTAGNSSIGNFASLGLYSYDIDYGGIPASRPWQIANPGLTWEKNQNINVGIDTRLFNRFNATIEWYHRKTFDLLLSAPLSSTAGILSMLQNIGEMYNTGVEVILGADVIRTQDFRWNIDFNLTYNKNEITALYQDQPIPWGFQRLEVGMPINEFYVKQWAGVNPADGRPMWYDADGNITFNYSEAAEAFSGNSLPKFYGGLSTGIEYKGITLSANMYYQTGNLIYENNHRILISDGGFANFNQHVSAMDRWQQPGDITDVPKRIHQNTTSGHLASSRWLYRGDYIRLRDVRLGYTLPKSIVEKVMLGSATIYAQGTNLWTSKYMGMDPEQGFEGDTWFQYPNAKTITFGLDISF